MNGPRSNPTRFGIPVNPETMEPYTDAQLSRVDRIKAAEKAFLDVLHDAEGSSTDAPGMSTRHMSIAATHLEIAVAMAIKGALASQ